MANYSKADLKRAINEICRECNDVRGEWHSGNDCTGKTCQLYPYRPGEGPGHAEHLPKANRNTEGLRKARVSMAQIRENAGRA